MIIESLLYFYYPFYFFTVIERVAAQNRPLRALPLKKSVCLSSTYVFIMIYMKHMQRRDTLVTYLLVSY
jgi:hypothetical protein